MVSTPDFSAKACSDFNRVLILSGASRVYPQIQELAFTQNWELYVRQYGPTEQLFAGEELPEAKKLKAHG